MPVSYIHGDAGIHNSFIDKDNELVIYDWERSRWDFIAKDVYSVEHYGDVIFDLIYQKWLDEEFDTSNVFSATAQRHIINLFITVEKENLTSSEERKLSESLNYICNNM